MESNKDESLRCFEQGLAKEDLGNYEQALKWYQKANKLYPSSQTKAKIKECLNLIKERNSKGPNVDAGEDERSNVYRPSETGKATKDQVTQKYTQEQLDSVKNILRHKDYFDILGLTKENTDEESLKRAYRKLALKFHPDKNHAPGATEAFKSISKAFDVLNSPDKRKRYEEFGFDEERVVKYNRRSSDYNDYDDLSPDDILAEELFNVFFGGSFTGRVPRPTRQRTTYSRRTTTSNNSRNQQRRRTTTVDNVTESPYGFLLQMSPLIFMVLLSLVSTLLVGDAPYSLQQDSKYTESRVTEKYAITYFVKPTFDGSIQKLERQVEEEYINNLKNNCYRERSHKESTLWRAQMYHSSQLYNQAKNLKTPSCDHLQKIFGS